MSAIDADMLLQHFDRISETPDAIPRLRQFILDLAIRGKLVEQDPNDEPASELLKRICEITSCSTRINNDTPFDLPASWKWSDVGSVTTKTGSGSTPRGGRSVYKTTGIPFLRSQNIHNDGLRLEDVAYIDEKTHQKMSGTAVESGDLLLNITGGSIGRCCRVPDKPLQANISQHVAIIRLAVKGMEDYFHKLILSPFFQSFVIDEQTGAGRGGLPKNRMDRISVPIPPVAEQHRIATKVDELMALCDRLEVAKAEREQRRDRLVASSLHYLNPPADDEDASKPEALRDHARFVFANLPRLTVRSEHIKQLRQTILNLAVRGRLVSQDLNDEPASTLLKRALDFRRLKWQREELEKISIKGKSPPKDWQHKYVAPLHADGHFTIPKAWVWASSLEICECVENGNTPPAAEMKDGEGDIPFIKVYNLTKNGELDFSIRPTFISRSTHEKRLSRSRILPSDVLMNIVGPPLGKVSVVPDTFPEWNTNQAVVLFRPSQEILSKYLAICLLSDSVLGWITQLAQQTVGQVNISVSKSRLLPIPVPPLAEQHRIVAKVDELMTLCDQLENQIIVAETVGSRLLDAVLSAVLTPNFANELEPAF